MFLIIKTSTMFQHSSIHSEDQGPGKGFDLQSRQRSLSGFEQVLRSQRLLLADRSCRNLQ